MLKMHVRVFLRTPKLISFRFQYGLIRYYSDSISKIRNIGILAHIDAGKTTTTERMLYYSGTTRSMGEVHHGNTVTDYMDQERQRGITIVSAAVSIPWRDHQLNLIDTPGHIDFTMEVEQSLAVLDGAIVVLDGSAGVEAQTLTVWRQSDSYRIPRLIYLNKLDRADSDVEMCVKSLKTKLEIEPLLLHIPVRSKENKLLGLVDIIHGEELVWNQTNRGQKYTRRKLAETDGQIWEKCTSAKHELIDSLSNINDELADRIIREDSLDSIDVNTIVAAVRGAVCERKAFAVLCGSSYKNIGVQTLMDAVIDYLPSPHLDHKLYSAFGSDLCARAFKVQHDDQKGVLTYLRLYNGVVNKAQKIYNIGKSSSEQSGQLYVAYADEYRIVPEVTAGNIAVVSGLKLTNTGDLITSSQSAASKAKSRLKTLLTTKPDVFEELIPTNALNKLDADEISSVDEKVDFMLGVGTSIPDPVFMCSIEPPSQAYQTQLETALAELQREDPSLRVNYDDDTGQIVLSGMGELHLEIIKERIIREYKIEVDLGPIQIAYKETIISGAKEAFVLDRKVGSTKQFVNVTMSAKPQPGVTHDKILKFDRSQESAANLSHLLPKQLNAIRQGVDAALRHGPKLGCPLFDVSVKLHWLEVGRGTSDSMLIAAVAQCLRKVFTKCEAILMEPVMLLEVVCPESHSAMVIGDLARRRSTIQTIEIRGTNKVIRTITPLAELLGYSTTLRSLSSGMATFTMEFHSNRQMSPEDEQIAVRNITGF